MTTQAYEYIIETRAGYFCEPIELKIVNCERVYYGFLDVPLAIASAYPDRPAALRAIDRFKIMNSVCGIIPVEKNGRRRVNFSLPARMRNSVGAWKKD